jgi:hypothetical protein
MFRHSIGTINLDCRGKLNLGAWEVETEIYEIYFRKSFSVGEKHMPLLVHVETAFRQFLQRWILANFLRYWEEKNR